MPASNTKPLVGRAAELTELRAALEEAARGRGGAVLVAGDAGIGKTRVVGAIIDRARGEGAVVLVGRCIDLVGPEVPYLAVLEALRSIPDADPVGRAGPPRARADEQLRLFDELRARLDGVAATAPVLLVLEDLHWADVSTLDFVAYLCRSVRDRRILLVATYRTDDLRPADPLARLAVELVRARDAKVLELPPLGQDELRELLEASARRTLPGELVDAVFERSGGNPFFAEELLAVADRGDRALPRLVRDALLQRVARISDAGQTVLRLAAAVGRDVPYHLLSALVPLPEPRLAAALRQAVEVGVLVPDRAAGTYRFRHALLAEAVYGTLLPGEAERLHERVARALTDHGGHDGELARHWIAAGRPVEALAASIRAARTAEAACGLAEALRHLERALELWADVPSAAKLADMDLATALGRAAELADLTGRGQRAVELVGRAIAAVDAATEPVRAGLLHERLGSYLLPIGDHAGAFAACRRAADLVPADPPSAERARVLTSLGNALMLSWRHADSLPVCAEALSTAEAIGDPRPALRALGIHGINLGYLGRPDEARSRLLAARELALDCGTPRDIAHSHAVLCELFILIGQPAEASHFAAEGMALARRWGVERSFGALLAAYGAEAGLETGDWDRADELLAEAHRSGTAFWAHYPRLLHAQLATARGDLAAAREHLETGARGERQPTSAARYSRVVAELALWEGRPDDAARAVAAGLAGSDVGRSPSHQVRLAALGLRAEADRVELAARAERADAENARRLLRLARRAATTAAAVTPDAAAWRTLAEAEYARTQRSPDRDRWRAAVAAWDELERPYPAAYCRWRLVEAMLGAPQDNGESVRIAREAYRVAHALGAVPLARELELLARRGRLDLVGLPDKAPAPSTRGLGLTEREGQVLLLLTRGYTNREIAAELTISVKTASVHVSHILRKLGVPRRLDAAAIGHRIRIDAAQHSMD